MFVEIIMLDLAILEKISKVKVICLPKLAIMEKV